MKKIISILLVAALALTTLFAFASCGKNNTVDANYFQHQPYLDKFNAENGTNIVSVGAIHVEPMGLYAGKRASLDNIDGASIGVPNDATNEARALLLLEANGYIKLKEGAGITATKLDIVENPHNIEIVEMDASSLPLQLESLDFAIINSNFALSKGLNPVKDSLIIEGSYSAYANIVAVKAGNENTPKTKALVAALKSQQIKDFIAANYDGAVISVVDNPTDGFDSTVDYSALNGTTITVAASPTPHAEILKEAAKILATKGITLVVQEYSDYVFPNTVVNDSK